jgi:hypothetical protein
VILYRVRDWDKHFENNRTRILANLSWVPMPNKMDGDGYTQLVDHKSGAAHLGAWLAIVEVASKCHPRGTLVREDGTPHTPDSLARVTRLPARVFDEVLPRLASRELGWMDASETSDSVAHGTIAQADAAIRHPSAADTSTNGMEQKGREYKKETSPSGRVKERTDKPADVAEAKGYWSEAQLHGLPEAFYDYFESNGWRTRQGPLKDWKAAARNWSRRESGNGGPRRLPPVEVSVGKAEYTVDPEATEKMQELLASRKNRGKSIDQCQAEFDEWNRNRKPGFAPSA